MREPLPLRRSCETFKLHFRDQRGSYHISCGFYDDGRLGEIFISSNRVGSAADAIARDGAILVSLLLHHGASLDTIKRALTREGHEQASTVIGAVVDRLLEEAQ